MAPRCSRLTFATFHRISLSFEGVVVVLTGNLAFLHGVCYFACVHRACDTQFPPFSSNVLAEGDDDQIALAGDLNRISAYFLVEWADNHSFFSSGWPIHLNFDDFLSHSNFEFVFS